jgi:hypothetical protein
MERAGAENGDIGAVAGDQRQRGAAGEQPLFTVPLAAKQDQLDIGTVAEQLGDIQRSVITVIGPFSWAATASSVLPASRNSVEPGDARGDLLAQALLGLGSRAFLPWRVIAGTLSAMAPPWLFCSTPCFPARSDPGEWYRPTPAALQPVR